MTDHLASEAALVGAVFLDERAADSWTVAPDDLASPLHREIARSALRLRDALQPVTTVTVADDLAARGLGGVASLDAIDGVASAAATSDPTVLAAYAASVLQAALGRRIVREGAEIVDAARRGRVTLGDTVAALQALAQGVLERLTDGDRYATMSELSVDLWAELERRVREDDAPGIPTGYDAIDEAIGGLRRGVMTVVGGRTSMGKSALARSIADNVSASGVGVHYFSLEDSKAMLAERQVADSARIGLQALAAPKGRVTKGDMASLSMAASNLRGRKNWGVEDRDGVSSADVAASVRRRRDELRTGLVVVDYLTRMHEPGDGTRAQVNNSLRGLQKLAREENVALLVLSQVGRDQEKESRAPRLSDLKESGAIEEQASCVLLLHREQVKDKPERAGVIVAKNKHGARDLWIPLQWDGPTATYRTQRRVGGFDL